MIRSVATPGHTPGMMSSLIPLKDGNNEHLAAYWGGPSIWFLPPEGLRQYADSTKILANADPKTDVELSNHPYADGYLVKIDALDKRKPGDPHPFVTGNAGVKKWMSVIRECTEATLQSTIANQN